jgi:hypothetical protein
MSTVCYPQTGTCWPRSPRSRSTTGWRWDVCPSRRGWRRGRWRRPTTPRRSGGGARRRMRCRRSRRRPGWMPGAPGTAMRVRGGRDGEKVNVGQLAAAEPLAPLPAVARHHREPGDAGAVVRDSAGRGCRHPRPARRQRAGHRFRQRTVSLQANTCHREQANVTIMALRCSRANLPRGWGQMGAAIRQTFPGRDRRCSGRRQPCY